jgi:hypothetical protein
MLPEVVSALDAQVFAMGRRTLTPVSAATLRDGPIYGLYGTWDYLIVPGSRSSAVEGLVDWPLSKSKSACRGRPDRSLVTP